MSVKHYVIAVFRALGRLLLLVAVLGGLILGLLWLMDFAVQSWRNAGITLIGGTLFWIFLHLVEWEINEKRKAKP